VTAKAIPHICQRRAVSIYIFRKNRQFQKLGAPFKWTLLSKIVWLNNWTQNQLGILLLLVIDEKLLLYILQIYGMTFHFKYLDEFTFVFINSL
jgi:hypothetical protein